MSRQNKFEAAAWDTPELNKIPIDDLEGYAVVAIPHSLHFVQESVNFFHTLFILRVIDFLAFGG